MRKSDVGVFPNVQWLPYVGMVIKKVSHPAVCGVFCFVAEDGGQRVR